MNILVTGASRGIGYQTVKLLAQNGHSVIGTARSEDALMALKKESPSRISVYPADLTDDVSVSGLCGFVKQTFPELQVLINNAGTLTNRPFEQLDMDDWKQSMEVNLFAAVRLTKALLPHFSADSHIVNVSSMGGYQGSSKFPGLSAYSVSKGALSILSECLALELSGREISVNTLCLGAVETEMFRAAFPDFQAPLTAEQMGRYLADFAVNGSTFFNGKILPVSMNDPG